MLIHLLKQMKNKPKMNPNIPNALDAIVDFPLEETSPRPPPLSEPDTKLEIMFRLMLPRRLQRRNNLAPGSLLASRVNDLPLKLCGPRVCFPPLLPRDDSGVVGEEIVDVVVKFR